MNKNVRWRLIVIVGVVALAVWAFYPPQQKINLGLDLKGGVHLVMRVQTDEALRIETETTVERLRETLSRAGVQYIEPRGDEPHGVRRRRASRTQAFRQAAAEVDTMFSRTPGAGGARPTRCGRTSRSSCAKRR